MANDFFSTLYNPDVLSCLANLSNDEVFTPPEIANQMLDMLPQALFQSPDTKFLDPACKSGVFLREIAKRLLTGLAPVIPDLQQRIDHIFRNQLYGIAITELTSLLSRRSVYCSKFPNSVYSVTGFDDAEGNIRFKRIQHRWKDGRCVFCGASENEYGKQKRDSSLETHAYELIHTTRPEEIYKMKFDVIIGNPPYQLSDGGNAASATPIYQKFVEQAEKLNPRFLAMIIPSRWFAGGRGLDNFRKVMLNDNRIRVLHDYLKSSEIFPGTEIKGGVCYFLWERDNRGDCKVFTHRSDKDIVFSERSLLEQGMDIFIRNPEQISILNKVQQFKESSFIDIVSAYDPFGFDVRFENSYKRKKPLFEQAPFNNSYIFYNYGWQKNGKSYVHSKYVRKGHESIGKWKIFITKAYGAGEDFPHQIINKPFIGEPNSVCSETYLMIGPFENIETATNVVSYISTRFFRFFVMFVKNTQDAAQKVYAHVPIQDFSKPWTDEELYAKYGLTDEEIAFIESMIRPMDLNGDDNGE